MAEFTLVADRTGDLRMSPTDKDERYTQLLEQLRAVLAGVDDLLAAMSSAACLLHNAFPYFYWTGFYRRVGPRELLVGPYQGTLGCLTISFDRGVCGACAREERTLIVDDVHAFPGHIACDSASASEIVVPIFDAAGEVIAVLDVDSTLPAAFDEADQRGLEAVAELLRERSARPVVALR